jgi:hypothetical protein
MVSLHDFSLLQLASIYKLAFFEMQVGVCEPLQHGKTILSNPTELYEVLRSPSTANLRCQLSEVVLNHSASRVWISFLYI